MEVLDCRYLVQHWLRLFRQAYRTAEAQWVGLTQRRLIIAASAGVPRTEGIESAIETSVAIGIVSFALLLHLCKY